MYGNAYKKKQRRPSRWKICKYRMSCWYSSVLPACLFMLNSPFVSLCLRLDVYIDHVCADISIKPVRSGDAYYMTQWIVSSLAHVLSVLCQSTVWTGIFNWTQRNALFINRIKVFCHDNSFKNISRIQNVSILFRLGQNGGKTADGISRCIV